MGIDFTVLLRKQKCFYGATMDVPQCYRSYVAVLRREADGDGGEGIVNGG